MLIESYIRYLEDKCCKGTKKSVVLKNLTLYDCRACLFDSRTKYIEQMLFENKKNEVYTVNKCKTASNKHDDKRCVQGEGITKFTQSANAFQTVYCSCAVTVKCEKLYVLLVKLFLYG